MYYVIGKPRNSSISQAQYRQSSNEINSFTLVKKAREKFKKKREIFVHKPEEEIYYEPYMMSLKEEFSETSIECDSKIELPWKDIALPRAELKIRQEVDVPIVIKKNIEKLSVNSKDNDTVIIPKEIKSTQGMELPWEDLIISDVIESQTSEKFYVSTYDSSLKIPWDDLTFEKPCHILPLSKPEKCPREGIEIPWDEIMVPNNITIESKLKVKCPPSDIKRRRINNDRPHNICPSNCPCPNDKKIQIPTGM